MCVGGSQVTPEQFLDTRSAKERNWGLWTYGARGDMLRELHAPVRVRNGSLVTREFVVASQQRGEPEFANVTVPYVHSYLVHAYVGATQNFAETLNKAHGQLHKLAFRTKNPLWMEAEDTKWGGLNLKSTHNGERPARPPRGEEGKSRPRIRLAHIS